LLLLQVDDNPQRHEKYDNIFSLNRRHHENDASSQLSTVARKFSTGGFMLVQEGFTF